jgi:hypothetical protein
MSTILLPKYRAILANLSRLLFLLEKKQAIADHMGKNSYFPSEDSGKLQLHLSIYIIA